MSGFFVSNFYTDGEFYLEYPDKCIRREMKTKEYNVKQFTADKFLQDKIFDTTRAGEIYIIEGCVLNKKQLMLEHGKQSWLETLEDMKSGREDYFVDFRGSFSGAHYSQKEDEWLFYTNHLGDHQVFYWNDNGKFIVTSDMNWLISSLKSAGIKYTLDIHSIKSVLTYGWVEGDGTIINEVRKLLPGHFIKIKSGKPAQMQKYHEFVNTKFTYQNEEEIIEEIDTKFRHAVALEYDKDNEYGYEHMALLSGGLDSRMALWIANDMGYEPITALTFGQSEGDDIEISNQIASELKMSHLVKTLDDAAFLQDIPNAVRNTFGLVEVSGTIHGGSMAKLLNFDRAGLLHGGLIGDAVIGSGWKNHVKASGLIGRNGSQSLIPYNRTYANEEMYFCYERVMKCALGVQCSAYEYAGYASPFTDIDFWEYCLTIPCRYRYNHYIYKKWILKYYPEAAKFKWEKTGARITDSGTVIKFKNTIKRIKRKAEGISELNAGMNPYEYWYTSKPEIREFLDSMFEDLIGTDLLENDFKDLMKKLYLSSDCRYKIVLVSALQSIREYF